MSYLADAQQMLLMRSFLTLLQMFCDSFIYIFTCGWRLFLFLNAENPSFAIQGQRKRAWVWEIPTQWNTSFFHASFLRFLFPRLLWATYLRLVSGESKPIFSSLRAILTLQRQLRVVECVFWSLVACIFSFCSCYSVRIYLISYIYRWLPSAKEESKIRNIF